MTDNLEQKNNASNEIEYAGFGVRVVATLVDSMITAPFLLIVAYFFASNIELNLNEFLSDKQYKTTLDMISLGISAPYIVYFLSSKSQATPGKALMKIQVVNVSGAKISPFKAFGRFLGTILSTITLGIGFLFVLFHPQRAALHDLICNTRVIYKR